MSEPLSILIGGNGKKRVRLDASRANRHGLIAGATGGGKTVTLQTLAEGFSRIGVPVFMADVKGDLSGVSQPATTSSRLQERLDEIGLDGWKSAAAPVICWDIFGKQGHPVRTTISEMGPLLLGNLLELNDTQSGVLYAAFKIADDQGMLLLDLKDLRAMLAWMGENAADLKNQYGNISGASIGAIQRQLLVLEEQGAEHFFAEPALKLTDLMRLDDNGHGVIGLLDAATLIAKSPRLYASFLLWLLAELYENLPEAGDAEKPKLVLFFDEAHLLFNDSPPALLDKVEQVVRLIRSKGVGVYFVSQSPLDIPENVLGQLGMRIQHALRAFTPKDKKAVKTAADTFRPNPEIDTAAAITELAIGEALVSTLDAKGAPTPVERVFVAPPQSRIGPASAEERQELLENSPVAGRYDREIDRESAYELLQERAAGEAKRGQAAKAEREEQAWASSRERRSDDDADDRPRPARSSGGRSSSQSVGEVLMKSVAREIGGAVGRKLIRGLLGSLLGGR